MAPAADRRAAAGRPAPVGRAGRRHPDRVHSGHTGAGLRRPVQRPPHPAPAGAAGRGGDLHAAAHPPADRSRRRPRRRGPVAGPADEPAADRPTRHQPAADQPAARAGRGADRLGQRERRHDRRRRWADRHRHQCLHTGQRVAAERSAGRPGVRDDLADRHAAGGLEQVDPGRRVRLRHHRGRAQPQRGQRRDHPEHGVPERRRRLDQRAGRFAPRLDRPQRPRRRLRRAGRHQARLRLRHGVLEPRARPRQDDAARAQRRQRGPGRRACG